MVGWNVLLGPHPPQRVEQPVRVVSEEEAGTVPGTAGSGLKPLLAVGGGALGLLVAGLIVLVWFFAAGGKGPASGRAL